MRLQLAAAERVERHPLLRLLYVFVSSEGGAALEVER